VHRIAHKLLASARATREPNKLDSHVAHRDTNPVLNHVAD
jgi:hypothetical protein